MSFLPITKKDYNTAVLMTDFIAKMRDSLESNNTLKFTPLINGYKIEPVSAFSDGYGYQILLKITAPELEREDREDLSLLTALWESGKLSNNRLPTTN